MVGGDGAWLIVDDTALLTKGEHSAGVAPQYASALSKASNYQSLVSLTLASREVPVMVACGCSCQKSERAIQNAWRGRVCLRTDGPRGRSRRSLSRASTV
jgi:hypothetical protein